MTVFCQKTGKIRYESKREAREHMLGRTIKIPKRRNTTGSKIPFETYQCDHCGGWHNASRSKRKHGIRRFET